MERVVLHVDANSFYASVECLYRPSIRGCPVAVCGDPQARHGIVLTSNQRAKADGVRTGMAVWQARQRCPGLVTVPPDFPLYVHFSQMMRSMCEEYSDRVESFGLDECWLDITTPRSTLAEGARVGHELRHRIKTELGITVSVGVSFNKVLAKLGSDMKKPDAVTVLAPENFREKTCGLPASDLLYVGPKTTRKLADCGIYTIGDLARAPSDVLKSRLGKNGLTLKAFACGQDCSPVMPAALELPYQSLGNSATTPHDIATLDDARCMYYLLAESVGARLRENGFRCRCVSISARTTGLESSMCQQMLPRPTCITGEIADAACALFARHFQHLLPLRSVGLSCENLMPDTAPIQLDMLGDESRRERLERLDQALDGLRLRFGHQAVRRGLVLRDRDFANINPKEEHTIHPMAFYKG